MSFRLISISAKSIHRAKAQKTKRVSQLFYKISREFLNNLTFSCKVLTLVYQAVKKKKIIGNGNLKNL